MRYLLSFSLSLALFALLGCGDSKTDANKTDDAAKTDKAQAKDDHDDHDHGEGPHKGKIIELGDYHAEWLADKEAGVVTVYILDGNAKENLPIDAAEVKIVENSSSDSFTLKAQAMEGEAEGKASRFVIEDKALAALLNGHVHAKLIMKIAGEPYSGDIDSH